MVNKMSVCLYLFALLGMFFQGCSGQANRDVLKILTNEREKEQTVIGMQTDAYFEFLTVVNGRNIEIVREPHGNHRSVGQGFLGVQQASDGRIATCSGQECWISEPESNTKKVLFHADHINTPLYWSPDNKFLLFVRDNYKVRLPLRCGSDDEHDVVIYELSSGHQSIITTVCGGYPYRELRWYVK